MPFAIPRTISTPQLYNCPGRLEMPLTIVPAIFQTVPASVPIMDEIPLMSEPIICPPIDRICGKFCVITCTNVVINLGVYAINCGNALIIPFIKATRIWIPAFMTIGRLECNVSLMVETIVGNMPISCGNALTIPFISANRTWVPVFMIIGRLEFNVVSIFETIVGNMPISCGNAFVIPWMSDISNSRPAWIIRGKLLIMVLATCWIIIGNIAINWGKASVMPWTSEISILIPALRNSGNNAIIPCTICIIASTTIGISVGNTWITLCTTAVSASISIGSVSDRSGGISLTICGTTSCNSCVATVAIPLMICCTLGITFFPNVVTLSTRFPTNSPKFALSSAMPVSKFCHAAFIAFAEPSIVVLASLAVVPVIPMLSCTRWIASTTSA